MKIILFVTSLLLTAFASGPEIVPDENNLSEIMNVKGMKKYRLTKTSKSDKDQNFLSVNLYFGEKNEFKYVYFDKLIDLKNPDWNNAIQTYVFDGVLEEISDFELVAKDRAPYNPKNMKLFQLKGKFQEWIDDRYQGGHNRWVSAFRKEYVLFSRTEKKVSIEWVDHKNGNIYIVYQDFMELNRI